MVSIALAVAARSSSLSASGSLIRRLRALMNEKLEALDNNDKTVKGPYAVGNVAGGLYSDSYMLVEGLTLGFAPTSGRIAGENSAAYVKTFK